MSSRWINSCFIQTIDLIERDSESIDGLRSDGCREAEAQAFGARRYGRSAYREGFEPESEQLLRHVNGLARVADDEGPDVAGRFGSKNTCEAV